MSLARSVVKECSISDVGGAPKAQDGRESVDRPLILIAYADTGEISCGVRLQRLAKIWHFLGGFEQSFSPLVSFDYN